MDKPQRDRIIKIIKARNQEYLASVATTAYSSNFDRTFTNVTRKTRSLIRKVYGSENSINEISRVGRLVSGFMEDIKQNKAPSFDFAEYKKILNDYLIKYLDTRVTDSRVTERLFTSTAVFDACTAWLDNKAAAYIAASQSRSPISSTTPAPRQAPAVGDFDIAFLHRNLKHVTLFRKSLHKPKP